MTPGVDALHQLTNLGYQVRVEGQKIHLHYKGPGKPDPDTVRPLFEVMKTHKPDVLTYLSKPASTSPPQTCESCPWYALNPWTHYPDFGAWCHHQMEHLVVGSPACEEFNRGAVPLKATPNTPPQAPAPGECVLSCADCDFHKYSGPNPRQGWGHCTFNNKWCYGLRPACSEIQLQDNIVPLDG